IDAGASLVITKRAASGASSVDRDRNTVDVPALTVSPIVDPIGAGDAFCAGFIAARLERLDVEAALRWGAACAAACVAVEGDVDGFPTRPELTHLLAGGPGTVR